MRLTFSFSIALLMGSCHSDPQQTKDMDGTEGMEVQDTSYRVLFESDSTKEKLIKNMESKIGASKTERKMVIDLHTAK